MSQGSAFMTLPPLRPDVAPPTHQEPMFQTSVGNQPQGPGWKQHLYNFSITPSAPQTVGVYPLSLSQPSISIPSGSATAPSYGYAPAQDPRFVPLPSTSDADLLDAPTIAKATGHSAALKVAGSRRVSPQRKDKGKRKRNDLSDIEDLSDVSEPPAKQHTHSGRRLGAGNYGEPELKELFRLVEAVLPFGQTGWKRVHARYNAWATKNRKSVCDVKALENKFKTLVRTRKPTGEGKRPECVTRAKAIDKLINEKLATRNINDDDDAEDIDAGLSEDNVVPEDDIEPVRTVIARSDRSATQQRRRTRNSQVTELSQKLTASLDPDSQRLRDEERATRSLQNTQIFTISQQLRDSNAASEALRRENAELRDRLYRTSQQRDRLDVELNFERRMSSLTAQTQHLSRRPGHKCNPNLTCVRGKIRHDEYFPDGGQCTSWITDGSSASDWDHEKENSPRSPRYHPYSRESRAASSWSPRPPSAPRALRSPTKGFSSPSRHIGFQSPNQPSFHSSTHSTFQSSIHHNGNPSVHSPVRKGYCPADSHDFPGPARCMKPPILPRPSSQLPSVEVFKPQHQKFSLGRNSPLLQVATTSDKSASLPGSAGSAPATTGGAVL